jgi:hypothetical protein
MVKKSFMTLPQSMLRSAIAATLTMICHASLAQYTSSLKLHIVETVNRVVTATYERAFHQQLSAQLSFQGGYYSKLRPTRNEELETTGFGAIGAVRYFPFNKKLQAPRGFFTYGALRYLNYTERYWYKPNNVKYEVGGQMYNAALGIGYKIAYKRIGVETFVGWGVGKRISDDEAYRDSVRAFAFNGTEDRKKFAHLEFALCYMLGRTKRPES